MPLPPARTSRPPRATARAVRVAVAAGLLLAAPGLAGCSALDAALGVPSAGEPVAAEASQEAAELQDRLGDAWPPVSPALVSLRLDQEPRDDLPGAVRAPDGRCGVADDRFVLVTGTPGADFLDGRDLTFVGLTSTERPSPGTPVPATVEVWINGDDPVRQGQGELVLDPDGTSARYTGTLGDTSLVVDVSCT